MYLNNFFAMINSNDLNHILGDYKKNGPMIFVLFGVLDSEINALSKKNGLMHAKSVLHPCYISVKKTSFEN